MNSLKKDVKFLAVTLNLNSVTL